MTGIDAQLAASLARRFRLVRQLGAGGMGAVYLAEQIAVGNRSVAVKVLNRKLLDDPNFLLRFQNEAASTGRIHHPNVVTIYESGQADDGTPYIAMEFLEGESLREGMRRQGPLPVAEVAEILQQAARGLNAAHKLGIIHRDLKPDNIFLTYPEDDAVAPVSPLANVGAPLVGARNVGVPLMGTQSAGAGHAPAPHADTGRAQDPPLRPVVVKIVDFGIAKLRESGMHTQTGSLLGTPAYMSYEQASGMSSEELDARSDVYSLGVVVYEMLTGSLPFQSATTAGYLRQHLQDSPPPFRAVNPGLPALPQLESVVMRALTKDRDQRYGSVMEFARVFAEATVPARGTVGAVREPPLRDRDTMLQPPAPPTSRHAISGTTGTASTKSRLPLWVGVPAAALLLILAGWYLSSAIHPRGGSPTQPASVQTPHETVPTAAGTLKVNPKDGPKDVSLPVNLTDFQPIARVNPKDGLKYVLIPPGTFMMGCSPGDTECLDDEKPAHEVTITRGFWLGQTEVTVGAYKRFSEATGHRMPPALVDTNNGWVNENMPIVLVTWDDAQAYCDWVGGRLPSEAEWEYAARGGSKAARYGDIDSIAWYDANSGDQMHDVAQKRSNRFGLYDMLGNIDEWVYDCYDVLYYQSSPSQDPKGPSVGQLRVLRGGSWPDRLTYVRVSSRHWYNPNGMNIHNGFRCGGQVFGL